ncbi:MAG TPA: ankyrin repeat domain-containing protein [Kofleriaceae bacterium]
MEDEVAAFLLDVGNGHLAAVKRALAAKPHLVNAIGPHPFWGGRLQALHVAVERGRGKLVKLLLRAGADASGVNAEYAGWSPLMLAKREKHRRLLREHGAKIGLGEALLLGDDKRLKRILRKPLPAELGDGSWLGLARTPKAIDWLVARGASTTDKDRWGATPMEAISRSGKRAKLLLRHLEKRGIAVDDAAFARIGDKRALKGRPESWTRPDVVKSAVDFRHHALVAWLLDHGADPNARATNRPTHDTCLHAAVWNGDARMVELLLERGADPTLRDEEHHGTPYEWAEVAERITNNPTCREAGERIQTMRHASAKASRGKRGKSAAGSP